MNTDTFGLLFQPYEPSKYKWPESKFVQARFPGNEGWAVGIDPGVNFGMTIIQGEIVNVIWGRLPDQKEKGMHGIDAMKRMMAEFKGHVSWHGAPAIVEGAAYHSTFGQVGLEEVRFGFFAGLHMSGLKVRIVPPATVRKIAFYDGKKQAGDIWPLINHNGADSIGMALAALEANHDL